MLHTLSSEAEVTWLWRRFFTLILLLFMLHSMGIGLFRFNGALCRNENVASTGGAFLFLVLLLLGGFLLAKDDIPPWWIWWVLCNTNCLNLSAAC